MERGQVEAEQTGVGGSVAAGRQTGEDAEMSENEHAGAGASQALSEESVEAYIERNPDPAEGYQRLLSTLERVRDITMRWRAADPGGKSAMLAKYEEAIADAPASEPGNPWELERLRAQLAGANRKNADWMAATGCKTPEEWEAKRGG